MIICSGIPGNECRPIPTPVAEFEEYHKCIIYGYDYSSQLLKTFDPKTIDDPTKFDKLVDKNANIIIKESAITAPGRAYVSDTISLKKKTVRLLDIFFKY